MSRGQLAIGALILLAMIVSAFAAQPGADSPLPSIENRGPRGAAVLATWLRESGVEVVALDQPLTAIPSQIRTVVLAAPSQTELSNEEVESLRTFARNGGAVVVLVSRDRTHPPLSRWLGLTHGEIAPLNSIDGVDDVGGTTVNVRFPGSATAGLQKLRLSAEYMTGLKREGAVPVTDASALWWFPEGDGEVWVSTGPDLIENARLELLDNAKFWKNLGARGPIAFDEYHLSAHAQSTPVSILASLAQLLVLAALFVWARAPRLGPVREEPATQHRSAIEYVRAMASLTANAKVEGELIGALKDDFRRRLDDEHGISRSMAWPDVARELERRTQIPANDVLAAAAETRFLPLSRALAGLEKRL
ncbi:MAG: DUF4350 domain-containing protein [Archangium sp.]|nr:DUF4350 domain-containing protein [Archangium sp.]